MPHFSTKIKGLMPEVRYQELLLSNKAFSLVEPAEIIDWLHDCAEKKLTTAVDSYTYSPIYYLFTGRRGLFVFNYFGIKTFICWHPNVLNTLLIFPPLSKNNFMIETEALTELVKQLPVQDDIEIHLCRVDTELQQKLKLHNKVFISYKENVLDWIYPVYLINTTSVKKMEGKHFQQIRQRLNQLDVSPLHIEPLNIAKHYIEILDLTRNWGEHHTDANYSIEDLLYPTKTLLGLFSLKNSNLDGQLIYHHNQLKSFAIWEKGHIANEFAIAADKEVVGLSEYQMYCMCKQLDSEGITRLNIGGSETMGLDRFKKKFFPTYKYNLNTFLINLPSK